MIEGCQSEFALPGGIVVSKKVMASSASNRSLEAILALSRIAHDSHDTPPELAVISVYRTYAHLILKSQILAPATNWALTTTFALHHWSFHFWPVPEWATLNNLPDACGWLQGNTGSIRSWCARWIPGISAGALDCETQALGMLYKSCCGYTSYVFYYSTDPLLTIKCSKFNNN